MNEGEIAMVRKFLELFIYISSVKLLRSLQAINRIFSLEVELNKLDT